MSGEGGAIAEVLAAAIREHADHMETYTLPALEPGFMKGWSHALRLLRRDAGFIGSKASPALADLLAAERQRGREEALREAVEGTTGWVPDPDAGEPYIYASDLRRALADVPAAAEGERE